MKITFIKAYLDRLRADKTKQRRLVSILCVMSLIVSLVVFWRLRLIGITMSNDTYCGMIEHEHTEECIAQRVLICGKEENLFNDAYLDDETKRVSDSVLPDDDIVVDANVSSDGENGTAGGQLQDDSLVLNAAALSEGESISEEPAPDENDSDDDISVYSTYVGDDDTMSDGIYSGDDGEFSKSEDIPVYAAGGVMSGDTEIETEVHVHTEACYKYIYSCGLEEHHHSVLCYSDVNADTETAAVWTATLPELSGEYDKDVAAVALSQLGYRESERNFKLAEDGTTHKGYTRYGAWYGNEYGDWSAMFASFCLHYAGLSDKAVPYNSGANAMYLSWKEDGLIGESGEYEACIGDLIFFDFDLNGTVDRIGIISGEGEYISGDVSETDSEGKSSDAVCVCAVEPDRQYIVSYGSIKLACDAAADKGVMDKVFLNGGELKRIDNNSFIYEDSEIIMKLYSEEYIADIELEVYDALEQIAEMEVSLFASDEGVSDEPEEEKYTIARYVTASRGEDSVNLEDIKLMADVTVKESVIKPIEETLDLENAAPEAEVGVELELLSYGEDGVEVVDSALVTADGETPVFTMAFHDDGIMLLDAGATANPKFTVQYYANLNIVEIEKTYTGTMPNLGSISGTVKPGTNKYTPSGNFDRTPIENGYISIINTKGRKLPEPGDSYKDLDIRIVPMVGGKNETSTTKQGIATTPVMRKIYKEDINVNYIEKPSRVYFDKIYTSDSYELNKIWVLKTGKSPDSTNVDDWDIYEPSYHFTNRPQTLEAYPNEYILINEGTVIRLVYNPKTKSYTNDVNFYDYDVSDGKGYTNRDGKPQGINSIDNYIDKKATDAMFAFGNANIGTGLASSTIKYDQRWTVNVLKNGVTKSVTNALNRANHNATDGNTYKGCTFGLTENNTLNVDEATKMLIPKTVAGVSAPRLFGGDPAIGKTAFNNGEFKLVFDRVGDNYTLTKVQLKENNQYKDILTELNLFNHPQTGSNKPYTNIYTNNFWPLDFIKYSEGLHDPIFGQVGNSVKFKGKSNSDGKNNVDVNAPVSDDGIAHNSYFGMDFSLNFDLSTDYCGPLRYDFFGDDEMWVYLVKWTDSTRTKIATDGIELVCDIGGVHSSVGEYVNLWDYIKGGEENHGGGYYSLHFFYTERGASGSTCYMRFTLPSVSNSTVAQDTGRLRIEKQASGNVSAIKDHEFHFNINFSDANGNPLRDDYSYTRYKVDGTSEPGLLIWDGAEFKLKPGEYIEIKYLPIGTQCVIEEDDLSYINESFQVAEDGVNYDKLKYDRTARCTISSADKTVIVQYINEAYYELPSTGGHGILAYTIGGIAIMAVPVIYVYIRGRNSERRRTR